jgi:hypothetical protein
MRHVAASTLAVSAILAVTQTASNGTPASPGLVTTPLNRATVDQPINIEHDQIRLHTIRSLDVLQVQNSAPSGWSSGWHEHNGPVIVSIRSGSLTFYQGSCTGVTVAAGHAFVEEPGVPVLARDEDSTGASWFTTQLIPVGATGRDDVAGSCGLS